MKDRKDCRICANTQRKGNYRNDRYERILEQTAYGKFQFHLDFPVGCPSFTDPIHYSIDLFDRSRDFT